MKFTHFYQANAFERLSSAKSGDVEQAWLNWKTEFLRISNKPAPIKERRVKHRHNPWIGSDIIKLMYERDFIHKKARMQNCPKMWAHYKSLRKNVTNSINQAKKACFEDLPTKYVNEPKKLWKELSRIAGNKRNDNVVPSVLTSDILNEYFVNIGSSITESLADPGELIWKNTECIYSFSFQSINSSCVLDQIVSLSDDSHLDVLDMDTRLIKRGVALLALLSLNYWLCHWVVACFQMTGNSLELLLYSKAKVQRLINPTSDQYQLLDVLAW